jgi:toxin ParE1/3/4
MARRVVWSARAIADVDAIAAYIATNSPSYARTVARKILTSTRSLAEFPFSGRIVPEVGDDSLREVFVYSYRVIYRVRQDEVVVTAVIHGRRIL